MKWLQRIPIDEKGKFAALASEVFAEAYTTAFPTEQALLSYVRVAVAPRAIEEELRVPSVWYRLGLDRDVPAGFIKMEKSEPPVPLDPEAETVELSKLSVRRERAGTRKLNPGAWSI